MAKVKQTSKQKAWEQLQKRIANRYAQGYYFQGTEFDYKKLTEKQIKSLKYSELDKYFVYVTDENQVLTPKEYRRQKKELGYEKVPEPSIAPTQYDIIEQIRDALDQIPNVIYARVKGGAWVDIHWQEQYPLKQIFETALATKDNASLNEFYKSVESELMNALEVFTYASDQDTFATQLSRAAILLKGGEPLSLEEAQQLSDLLDEMEGE